MIEKILIILCLTLMTICYIVGLYYDREKREISREINRRIKKRRERVSVEISRSMIVKSVMCVEEIKKGCKHFKLLVWGTCDNCRKGNQIDRCELFDSPFPKKRTCNSWWEVKVEEQEVSR